MRFPLRRRMCRATFCVFCLLPTLLVGSAAVVVNTPTYHRIKIARWRDQLVAQLGLEVEFSRLDWHGSRHLVIYDIELRDPESHEMLARAHSADIMQSDKGPVVTLGPSEIVFERLPRLVRVLHEHLLLRNTETGGSFQLSAPTVVLQAEPRSESVLDVRFALDVSDDGSEALVEFRPTDAKQGELVRLRVVRNRQLDPPATGWELHTGPTGLPCQLARAWMPQLDNLGEGCSFEGSIWTERLASGWQAEVSGVLRHLDLDRLVTGRFPHKLSGMAKLTLTQLNVRHGQVVEARGQLASAGGVISETLISAATEHLTLKRNAPATETMLVLYSDLYVEFSLDESGLAIAGADDQHMTVLAGADGPMLTSQGAAQVSPQSLIQLLVPLADLQVPAAEETKTLLQVLPLPRVTPSDSASARREYRPLELRLE